MRMSPNDPKWVTYNFQAILVMAACVIAVPLLATVIVRVLLVGAPFLVIGGIVIFIASYLEGRD